MLRDRNNTNSLSEKQQILSGIPGVHVYLENLNLTSKKDQEHFERLLHVVYKIFKTWCLNK